MARDFNGTNESITLGSDPTVDAFSSLTIAMWMQRDVQDANYCLASKPTGAAGWVALALNDANTNTLEFTRDWSTNNGSWRCGPILTAFYHVVIVYSDTATTNDPTMYIDGVEQAASEVSVPGGTANSDAASALRIGETGTGGSDLNGAIQYFTYANALWTAAQVNRHRWHGRVGGPVAVHHPLLTTKLANEGTATADGVATGTTIRSLPRGSRPGCGVW